MAARILIIEDHADNRELMSYLLTAFGYETISAEDGLSGMECMERERPDLVICDIQMPGFDGYEVVRRVKGNAAVAKIPLVAITALAMVGDRDRILEAGFDGYIPKPITPDSFIGEVEAFLPRERRPERQQARHAPVAEVCETAVQGIRTHSGSRGTILAVDNHRGNLELARSIFEPSGYTVATATSVPEALAAARRIRPGLILSDVSMPDLGGYDLAEAVRADPDLNPTPVILISSSQSGDGERALAAGAAKFLRRPIDPGNLLSEVGELLAQRENERHAHSESR